MAHLLLYNKVHYALQNMLISSNFIKSEDLLQLAFHKIPLVQFAAVSAA